MMLCKVYCPIDILSKIFDFLPLRYDTELAFGFSGRHESDDCNNSNCKLPRDFCCRCKRKDFWFAFNVRLVCKAWDRAMRERHKSQWVDLLHLRECQMPRNIYNEFFYRKALVKVLEKTRTKFEKRRNLTHEVKKRIEKNIMRASKDQKILAERKQNTDRIFCPRMNMFEIMVAAITSRIGKFQNQVSQDRKAPKQFLKFLD